MILLPDGSQASPGQILAALVEEAHRRGVSYGALSALDTVSKAEIVRIWAESRSKRDPPRAPEQGCDGCAYWRSASSTSSAGYMACHYLYDIGHVRKISPSGECLEKNTR